MQRRVFRNAQNRSAGVFAASDAFASRRLMFGFAGWQAAPYRESMSFDTLNSGLGRLSRRGQLHGSSGLCGGSARERHDDTSQPEFAARAVFGGWAEPQSRRNNRKMMLNSLRELDRFAPASHAYLFQSSGTCMAGQKVLYVCFDFSQLVSSELALLEMGYDVTTVLGTDGVLGLSHGVDFCKVLLGDGAVEDREYAKQWLNGNYPDIPVINMCDLQIEF